MVAFKDLTGKKYKKWKIIERGENKGKRIQWLCQCQCGNKKLIVAQEIHADNVREDCGCSKQNWIGKKINLLTVVSKEGNKSFHNSYVNCVCDCGNEKRTWGTTLRKGTIKSCGCIHENSGKNRCLNLTYAGYKKRGSKIGFEITIEQFYKISQENCIYCGCRPKGLIEKNTKTKGKRTFVYNGIDRVDNTLGYTLENSVPCCGTCNLMKNDMQLEEWLKHIKKILDRVDLNLNQPTRLRSKYGT